MTSKKETQETTPGSPSAGKRRRRSPSSAHTAEQKAQAVLAIWTERVKIAEVMRTLAVPYMTLQQWQQRAMEGMLQALEPRTNLADGAALSPRLRALLRRQQVPGGAPKLQARLKRLSEIAPAGPSAQP